ncbi:hypothetical protein VNI00_018702 [Paramarasmius palmivorus]|uniref:Zn(2)-C6 fungal-type domain-containing protein n=1 Tax=Paramarasmius palmivorus TaxID=297713 RepID=A0AAW0AWC2_9AGAR
MPEPVRNPFAPPKPVASKPKRARPPQPPPLPDYSPEEIYERQLGMYERGRALIKAFRVYYNSAFDRKAEVFPSPEAVAALFVAQKDNIREYHRLCNDDTRGFEIPKAYHGVILQIYRLAHMAVQAKVIKAKATASWLPPEEEVEDLIAKYEDFDFRFPLPPPVAPLPKTPPPVASSSRVPKRKGYKSNLDNSDSDVKSFKRQKTDQDEDSSSDGSDQSEDPDDRNAQIYGGQWYEVYEGENAHIAAENKKSLSLAAPSQPKRTPRADATVTVRVPKKEVAPSKPKGKEKAPSAPRQRGKDKAKESECAPVPDMREPRLPPAFTRVSERVIGGTSVSKSGERTAYQPPAPLHNDEDDGFINDELSTAGGHVYLQGNVQLTYDSVVEASTIAPEPNFYTQGCDRCIQKGLGCSPRPDGHAGCTGCKSTNQKCSFTQSLEECLSARDEQFDLGLQGHNGLAFQLEGILGTLGSLQSALDIEFQARQQALRLNRTLERQRLILQRSTRDPRVICALLRLLHPDLEALTHERLLILLTALKIPHSSFDVTAAGYRFDGKDISIIEKSSGKILATYQQVVSRAESAYPPVDLAKWLEARVGPEYVIKDKTTSEDAPGSSMALDSKSKGSPKASGSTVKTISPRSVLDVPVSTSHIKDSKIEKKVAGSKSPMVVEKVGGSSSGDAIKDKSPREQSASSDSDSE